MRRKKGDIRLSDLPPRLQIPFTEKFTPRLYELFGTLSAWEQPSNSDIQTLWKDVFPQEQSLTFETREETIVIKLVRDVFTLDVPTCCVTNTLSRLRIDFHNGGRDLASAD
jgi:hypothetical protein